MSHLELIEVKNLDTREIYFWDTDTQTADEFMEYLQEEIGVQPADDALQFKADFDIASNQTMEEVYELSRWATENEDIAVEFIGDHNGDWCGVESDFENRCGVYPSFLEMAYDYVEGGLLFGEVEGSLANYIDYDAIARDLEIGERHYVGVDSGDIYIFCH